MFTPKHPKLFTPQETLSTCSSLERNYDLIQDSLMEKHELLTPGKEIEIRSKVYSVDLFNSSGSTNNDDESMEEINDGSELIQNRDHLFVIDHLLHLEECREILRREVSVGFESIASEYPEEYRNSKRILFNDKTLAVKLWRRLKKYLIDCNFMKPYGLDTEGRWIPIAVNECMRLSKYEPGNYFKPHTDGQFVRNDDERSIYTLLIYLNDGFVGGETKFMRRVDPLVENQVRFKNLCDITPKLGSASIFNHELYHQGSTVTDGIKYILRTEIMFKRVGLNEELLVDKKETKELYDKVMSLLKESDNLEKQQRVTESTVLYRKAQELLINHGQSTSLLMNPKFLTRKTNGSIANLTMKSSISQLPDEIIFHICKFLNDWEICKLIFPLDRYFNYLAKSSQLWEWMYMKKWGNYITNLLKQFHSNNVEELRKLNSQDNTTSLEETPSEEQDWFQIYVMKCYFEKEFEPICVDLGSNNYSYTYFATINGEVEKTVTKAIKGATRHSSLARFSSYYLPSNTSDSRSEIRAVSIYISNNYTKFVQPFVDLIYKELKMTCKRHPIIISVPSKTLTRLTESKQQLEDYLFKIKIPAVCILPRCYLLSIFYNISTCLVVDISESEIYAHAIIQNDKNQIKTVYEFIDTTNYPIYRKSESSKPSEQLENQVEGPLVKALDNLLNQFSDENVKTQLMDNIILSGIVVENSYEFNFRKIGEESMSKKRDLIRRDIQQVFNSPNAKYKIKHQTSGEEAIKAAQLFSKIPNLKDYFTYWFDCKDIVREFEVFE